MIKHLTLLILFVLVILSNVQAKKFSSKYSQFELPPGWSCTLEDTEWVCQSLNGDRKKEAIIIQAAKMKGPQDSLDQYMGYLKKEKTTKLPGGKFIKSEVKFSKLTTINGQRWVDSLHIGSEVPGFYTRYLATIKGNLGIAVTFSVAKDHYAAYQGLFDKIIGSLKVFATNTGDVSQFKLKRKSDNLLDSNTTFIPDSTDQLNIANQKKRKGGSSGSSGDTMILLLVAAGVGGFLYMKKKKGKKKKKKKK